MPQSLHDTLPPLSEQLQTVIQDGWEQEVLSQLPADYEQQARSTGAFVRVRGLASVADLLRGLLALVLCASSLRHLGSWAVLIGLANLSHVAWHKRLRQARPFLLWLLGELLAVPAPAAPLSTGRIVLVDATRLKEPGGCGDDWRLHLGYDLVAGRLLDVKVSDQHTAEGFTLFDWQAGDLVVADRGYCRRGQLAFVLRAGAQLVVRLAVWQVPLLDAHGEPFDVLSWLTQQGSGQHACSVAFEYEGRRFAGRLIACALPEEAAERARAKERKKASKQQRQLKEETLVLCGWLLLFTSVPTAQWSDEQVLALYRARWQIELVIKRMKQVLRLAQLRGKTAATNEATILALLVAWALQQSEAAHARQRLTEAIEHGALSRSAPAASATPPSAGQHTVSSWTVTALSVQTLRLLVQGYWTFARLRACLPYLQRYLCSRRRHRSHQESTIRQRLLVHLGHADVYASLDGLCSSA
jgi:Transposase DDE domain